jgi:hypothetical protein
MRSAEIGAFGSNVVADSRAALLRLAPHRDAEVGGLLADLAASRKRPNLLMVVDTLQCYAGELARYRAAKVRIEREAALRLANLRRKAGAPWIGHGSWKPDPERGSPLVDARHWANRGLTCARVPERLRPRLLDLIEECQASPRTADENAS